jgi:hypothetical protein
MSEDLDRLFELIAEVRAELAAVKAKLELIEEGIPLYANEAETARRLGISQDRWRAARRVLEPQGLPKRDSLFNRRFWPAVEAFFNRRYGLETSDTSPEVWKENLEALRPGRRKTKVRRFPG